MRQNQLVEIRCDDRIARYTDVFSVNQAATDSYARTVGVESALERRAKASGEWAPVTVNFHSGYRIASQPNGTKGVYSGCLTLDDTRFDEMPSADIDIFLGSNVIRVLGGETPASDRDVQLSIITNDTLRHELIHFGDPDINSDAKVNQDPHYRAIFSENQPLIDRFHNKAGGYMAGVVITSGMVGGAVAEVNLPYHNLVAIASGIGTFVVGSAAGGLLLRRSYKDYLKAAREMDEARYELDPRESYVREVIASTSREQLVDVLVNSFALRKLEKVKSS